LEFLATYENVVMRKPVNPNDAVHAGNKQLRRFTTTMIAKESQNARPKVPPTMPVDKVATAILALNLAFMSIASQIWISCYVPKCACVPDVSSVL
jgi:hypothetical protein